MATNRTRKMLQTATYWSQPTNDGLGNYMYGTPELLNVRWEQKSELFRDAEAREVMSNAVVYTPRPLSLQGWMILGDETGTSDPRTIAAYEIRQSETVPNLRNTEQLSKVYL